MEKTAEKIELKAAEPRPCLMCDAVEDTMLEFKITDRLGHQRSDTMTICRACGSVLQMQLRNVLSGYQKPK